MDLYAVLVFVHVVGAVGIFAAIAIEVISVRGLQVAHTPSEIRVWMGPLALPFRLGPLAMLITLISGMWMAAMGWGRQPWLLGALVGIVEMGLLSGLVTLRGVKRLRAALASESGTATSNVFRSMWSGTGLAVSLSMRIAIGVAILGLMTTKPDAVGSAVLLATATVLGLFAGVVLLSVGRSRPVNSTEA